MESDAVVHRARLSNGTSSDALYQAVARLLRGNTRGGDLYDIGCGAGELRRYIDRGRYRYVGVDAARYTELPHAVPFHQIDLDAVPWALPAHVSDCTVSIETIEHLENPRAFFRELRRVTRPGGRIVVTTPNQLSLLSKLTLVTRNEFNAFQEAPGLYPAHRTALLEIDLLRIAAETGLEDIAVRYTGVGRIPGSARPWPAWLRLPRRAFSDNVLITAVRP
jgi:2-polyprenyl-3-methyl-5-hydroxy-6-metoxy-1,4-benzoquinol methylase